MDYIIRYDSNGNPIWKSDVCWWEDFIGYVDNNGIAHMYGEEVK